MILYHGTNDYFSRIDLSKSRIGKDFGIGFYLTTDELVARRQAERDEIKYHTVVMQYLFATERAIETLIRI